MSKRLFLICTLPLVLLLSLSRVPQAQADSLLIGNDISSPVTVYTTSGTFVQFFGQNSATGSAINAAGDIWTVAPSFGNNKIVEYDPAQNVLNSFVATINGQWVEDMSHGLGNNLYLATFEGNVFTVNDQTGAILGSFSVANSSFTGVAFDGTNLWTSGGLTSNNLFKYTTGGVLLAQIPINATCGGVGFDASSNTLWCGGFGIVNHYDLSGNFLGSFTTASGSFHDGVEAVNLLGAGGGTATPEPGTMLLLGVGVLGLAAFKLTKR